MKTIKKAKLTEKLQDIAKKLKILKNIKDIGGKIKIKIKRKINLIKTMYKSIKWKQRMDEKETK